MTDRWLTRAAWVFLAFVFVYIAWLAWTYLQP